MAHKAKPRAQTSAFGSNQSCGGSSHSFSPHTDIRQFALLHRLKWRSDGCSDRIIPGKHGEIGGHGDGRLNACFRGVGAEPFSRLRAHRIRQAIQQSIGQRITGAEGADEALFVFDPLDEWATNWFIHALGIKRRRSVSPETSARLAQFSRLRRAIAGKVFHGPGAVAECCTTPSPAANCIGSVVPNRSVGMIGAEKIRQKSTRGTSNRQNQSGAGLGARLCSCTAPAESPIYDGGDE